MKSQISFSLTVLLFLAGFTGVLAESSAAPPSFSIIPSAYGISGSFGLGYAFGEGADLAKGELLETGADTSEIIGSDVWQIDIFTQWAVTEQFGGVLNISLSPLSFAVIGYNTAGKAVEGLSYSYLNMDIAALLSYNRSFWKGIFSAVAGPLLGFRLGDGQVLLKSEDVTSKYKVPGEQMLNASLGGMIGTGYSLPVGPGFIDFGLKITYHYSSVQGFLIGDAIPVNIITPSVSIGYSLRGKK